MNDLVAAINRLWETPPPAGEPPRKSPAFMRVVEALRRVPGHVGAKLDPFRVENAILALGPPWPAGRDEIAFPLAADKAAERLREWLTQTEATVVHLCPLDYADKLPEWRFGPNEVRCLPASELDELVAPARLRRHYVNWVFDSRRFSEFQWLVVRETRPLRPERLEVSHDLMIEPVEHAFGTVVPHMSPFTGPVEMALFALLLLPWEEVAEGKKFRWQPFRVPWVYTIKSDPFETPNPPPRPESLSWQTIALTAPDGTIDEIEEPDRWDLDKDVVKTWEVPNDAWWERIEIALQSDLFRPPIVHFLVRAFLADDIDEFLAHICTIEAALGLKLDHDVGNRPQLPKNKNPGATERLARRCAALLCDRETHATLCRLYRRRGDYLHGRPMEPIRIPDTDQDPPTDLLSARTLARRVSAALTDVAAAQPSLCRDVFLDELLKKGTEMIGDH